MNQMILQMINHFGYIGVAFLIALENIFPPIPSEVILTFGGFLTTVSRMNLWGVILSATIGSVFGALGPVCPWQAAERGAAGAALRQQAGKRAASEKRGCAQGGRLVFAARQSGRFLLPFYSAGSEPDLHSGGGGQNGNRLFSAFDHAWHSHLEYRAGFSGEARGQCLEKHRGIFECVFRYCRWNFGDPCSGGSGSSAQKTGSEKTRVG